MAIPKPYSETPPRKARILDNVFNGSDYPEDAAWRGKIVDVQYHFSGGWFGVDDTGSWAWLLEDEFEFLDDET